MLGLQAPPNGPATPVAIQVLGDLLRRHASDKLSEDPLDNPGLVRHDLALTRRERSAVQCLHDAIAVAQSAGGFAVLDATAKSAMCLLREIFQEQGVHRALESDVQVRDVALGERHDVHAGEGEALEQSRSVFLVAAEAVQRFSQYHIESTVQCIAHQRLETRAQQRCARHGVVRVLVADLPALPLRERAAHPQLIGDRCVPLVVRRVTRVDGDFHCRSPLVILLLRGRSCLAAALEADEALARGLSRQGPDEGAKRNVGPVVIAPVALHGSASPMPPAASRSWRSSFGHDTPAHSQRRCAVVQVNGRAERISRRIDF